MKMYTISYYWFGNIRIEEVPAESPKRAADLFITTMQQKYSVQELSDAMFRVVDISEQ